MNKLSDLLSSFRHKDKTDEIMVENIFNKLFSRQETRPPEIIEKAFDVFFKEATSAEWHKVGSHAYEVMFYEQEKEHIARFNKDGELIDHRINMKPEELPVEVFESARSKGEIMSAIAVYHIHSLFDYEIIFRNTDKIRFVMHLTPSGEIKTVEKL